MNYNVPTDYTILQVELWSSLFSFTPTMLPFDIISTFLINEFTFSHLHHSRALIHSLGISFKYSLKRLKVTCSIFTFYQHTSPCMNAYQVASVMFDSLRPYGPLPTRLLCPWRTRIFSRQEYWHVLPCPPPGDLPNPGIELSSLMSYALAGGFLTTSAT